MTPSEQKIIGNDENRASQGFDDRGLLGESKDRSAQSWLPDAPAVMSAPHALSSERFSTDDLPAKDRVAMWREHFGRTALRVEIEPTEESSFEACVTSHILPGLHVLLAKLSAARITRTRELIADGNDDLYLLVNRTGEMTVSARGRELALGENDAVLTSSSEVTVFHRRSSLGECVATRIPYSMLSPMVVDVDVDQARALCEDGRLSGQSQR